MPLKASLSESPVKIMAATVSFADLLAQYDRSLRAGDIVKGTIIEVRPKEVLVDIGGKSEGVVSGGEFENFDTVKVGDLVIAVGQKFGGDRGPVLYSQQGDVITVGPLAGLATGGYGSWVGGPVMNAAGEAVGVIVEITKDSTKLVVPARVREAAGLN